MSELISQIASVARGMWKHRWLGMAVAWGVAVLGTIIVFAVPDKYEAGARIYVNTQSILKPLMAGLAVQPNVEQQVVMLSRTLITRPNIEKLIRMADLDLGNTSKDAQEALIDRVMKTVEIKNVGRDNLYTLSFRDSNPDKAKRVVQSLVSIFIESSMGESRRGSDDAKKFIDEQIKTYVAKLEEAENRLKEFKLRNIDMQTQDGKDVAGRIGDISNQLNQARLELREAENSRDEARRQLDAQSSQGSNVTANSLLQESSSSIATPEIDARIEAQKRNLDALLQRFTDQHPDVIGARRLIKELEDIKRKEVQEQRKVLAAAPAGAGGGMNNLAYQELNRLRSNAEVQVAALKARVAEYEKRYAAARAQIKTAPQIEAEFAQLNRDYAINKKNYEELVAKRESASLSGELDNASGVADFNLIDPPRVNPQPVAPNRFILLPLVLVVALLAGSAAAFASSQIRPVFHDAHALRSVLGLPLLGVVTLVVSDAMKQRERKDLRRFIGASSGLISLFGVGIAIMYVLSTRVQ
jgi:polysaccharide chain length determinant protein (PEP-CTERM system associated)